MYMYVCMYIYIYIYIYTYSPTLTRLRAQKGPHRETPSPEIRPNKFDTCTLQ